MDTVRFIKAVQAGDQSAFDSLLNEEALRLHALTFHITGDRLLAEEAVRRAFLQIREGQSSQEEENGRAWITRLAARMAVEVVRERGEAPPEPEQDSAPLGQLPAEVAWAVTRGIRALPMDVRAAIWLHIVEGDGLDEVAVALGSERAAVSRQVRSGLDELRISVEGQGVALNTMPLRRLLRQLPVPAPSPEFLAGVGSPGYKAPEPRRVEAQPAARPPAPVGGDAPPADSAPAPVPATAAGPAPPVMAPAVKEQWSRRVKVVLGGAAVTFLMLSFLLLWFSGAFTLLGSRPPAAAAGGAPAGPEKPAAGETPVVKPRKVVQAIAGRVVDEKRQPVQGVEVMAYRDFPRTNVREVLDRWGFVDLLKEHSRGWPALSSVRSGEKGQFKLSVTASPNVVLQALSVNGRSARGGLVRVRSGDTGQPEIVLSEWKEITGIVLDQRGPLEGAQVLVVPDPTPASGRDFSGSDFLRVLDQLVPAGGVTDQAGAFRVFQPAGAERKRLLIVARKDKYATGYAPWNPARQNVLRLWPAAPISGQLLGSGDAPASGARILARKSGEGGTGWFAAAITDDEGNFSFEGSTAAEFQLLVKLPVRPAPEKASWKPGDPLPLRLEFGGGVRLQGQVRLAGSGRPVEGVRILCRDLEGGLITSQTVSDADGHYLLRGLPADSRYDLLALIPGFVPKDRPKPPEKTDTELNIELVPTGTIRGKVTRDGSPVEGSPVETIVIANSDEDVVQLRWRKQLLGQVHVESRADGSYTLDDVDLRGQVFLWTYDNQGECWAGPLRFAGEDRPAAEVNLQITGTTFEVVVSDGKGAPIFDADIELTGKVFADRVPPGMTLMHWFTQRTSMDASWFSQQMSITPGYRKCQPREDTRCQWTDLMLGSYLVSVTRELSGTDLPAFFRNSQVLTGFLEKPLVAGKSSTLRVSFAHNETLSGKIERPDGTGVLGLRVKVGYSLKHPELLQGQGYTITHTAEGGVFDAGGLGPGPYRVTASDEGGNVAEVNTVAAGTTNLKILWNPGGSPAPPR